MLHEVGWRLGTAMSGKVFWAGAHHLSQIGYLMCKESRIAELSHAQRDVHVVAHQVDRPVRDQEIECDAGIAGQEVRQRWRKMIDGKRREHVNAQVSAW